MSNLFYDKLNTQEFQILQKYTERVQKCEEQLKQSIQPEYNYSEGNPRSLEMEHYSSNQEPYSFPKCNQSPLSMQNDFNQENLRISQLGASKQSSYQQYQNEAITPQRPLYENEAMQRIDKLLLQLELESISRKKAYDEHIEITKQQRRQSKSPPREQVFELQNSREILNKEYYRDFQSGISKLTPKSESELNVKIGNFSIPSIERMYQSGYNTGRKRNNSLGRISSISSQPDNRLKSNSTKKNLSKQSSLAKGQKRRKKSKQVRAFSTRSSLRKNTSYENETLSSKVKKSYKDKYTFVNQRKRIKDKSIMTTKEKLQELKKLVKLLKEHCKVCPHLRNQISTTGGFKVMDLY